MGVWWAGGHWPRLAICLLGPGSSDLNFFSPFLGPQLLQSSLIFSISVPGVLSNADNEARGKDFPDSCCHTQVTTHQTLETQVRTLLC